MCGIAGIFRRDAEPIPPGYIHAMVATLRHRGPDGDGTFFAPGIGFGHTRLAIIDLSEASSQPFHDPDAGLTLIFNGEIYNYVELREELKGLGHRFRTSGDTEVLLRAYEEWGTSCLGRLNGMFAFGIWDAGKRSLFLARDRFGEKPLYVARSTRGVAFASEMKAILTIRPELRAPNEVAIYRYLARGDLDLDHETFFSGIEALPAAHYMVVDDKGAGAPVRYWRPTSATVPVARQAAIEGFRELLFDSVRLRQRSDVPVGSSLSGGLDSSSIVAIINAQKAISGLEHQRTFSARFHSTAHDEGKFIAQVIEAVDADAHNVWVNPEKFVDEFRRLQHHQEEPVASASPFAQWCVMRLAAENSTTVLLDGQGADELLAGYDQAHGMFWAHWLRSFRPDRVGRELLAYVRRYHGATQPALFAAYYVLPETVRDRLAERYYRSQEVVAPALHQAHAPAHVDAPHPFPDRLRNELVRWQTVTQLPEFLRYADRNSMAFSREVRLPFLDHRLVEFAFGLPLDLVLDHATTKVVLREAMRGIVPNAILNRRDKLAYAPPQHAWFQGPLREWVNGLLRSAEGRTSVFNSPAVVRIREQFSVGKADTLAWRVASTEGWFQVMIDEPERVPGLNAAEISGLVW